MGKKQLVIVQFQQQEKRELLENKRGGWKRWYEGNQAGVHVPG